MYVYNKNVLFNTRHTIHIPVFTAERFSRVGSRPVPGIIYRFINSAGTSGFEKKSWMYIRLRVHESANYRFRRLLSIATNDSYRTFSVESIIKCDTISYLTYFTNSTLGIIRLNVIFPIFMCRSRLFERKIHTV